MAPWVPAAGKALEMDRQMALELQQMRNETGSAEVFVEARKVD